MNILLVTSAANLSGGSRQALYQAEGLEDRGHRLRFFVPRHSELPDLAPERGFWVRFTGNAPSRAELEAAFARDTPNVVHAFHNAAVKALAWQGLFWRKKAATAAHRGVIFRPGNPLPYWSPGIDRFLVNSRDCGRVLSRLGLSRARIEYLPNAVPDSRLVPVVEAGELRAAFGIEPASTLFLCIGGNKPYKGTEPLLRAWALAFAGRQNGQAAGRDAGQENNGENEREIRREAGQKAGPRLLLVGHNPEQWQGLAAELGIASSVRFAGRREDVGSFLAAADAFVLPSLSESMPNTLLEALRAGLPCAGSRVGATPDILAPEKAAPCGLLVPPGDAPALAGALRRLADDDALRASLAEAAKERGLDFSPEKRLDHLENIYRDILRRKALL